MLCCMCSQLKMYTRFVLTKGGAFKKGTPKQSWWTKDRFRGSWSANIDNLVLANGRIARCVYRVEEGGLTRFRGDFVYTFGHQCDRQILEFKIRNTTSRAGRK